MIRGKAAKTKVKNKAPAEIQITAEQILREAKERELEIVPPPPKQKISDPDELADYQLRKRKAFEDNIRKNRSSFSNWIKYAKWEESQQEIQRARSIYERALDVDYRNIKIWLKYSQMEMRNRQINHARNVLDRAVLILPRVNQFWYKYVYMEEMLQNLSGCRQVFERWMDWEPNEQAWFTYVKFELRYNEIDRVRAIYSRFVTVHPEVKNWIRFAHFEEQNGFIANSRDVYEKAIEFFGDDYLDEYLFMAFARFEESQHEYDRVRVIYKYALEKLSIENRQNIFKQYSLFEKKHGNRFEIEDVIFNKRKTHYEDELKQNPFNYDLWFDYVRLMEDEGDVEMTREVYEKAVANVPLKKEKRLWRRYIYLWIYYAIYEELENKDYEKTREIYKFLLEKLIPHKSFTFAKIWIMAAKFEIRRKNLTEARKILGTSIGLCPKDKLFKEYIELEIQLREFDRCRILYQKYLEYAPHNCITWMKFAELENILGEIDRARQLFEIAIDQPKLDMPEVIWKAYIDFEIEMEEFDLARNLYERLLERTEHVKVWISFAQFELLANKDDHEFGVLQSRNIYQRANRSLKDGEKESRLMLLEAWLEFETKYGDEKSLASIRKQMPKKVKKRRKIQTDDGSDAGWEEYFDYIFPNETENAVHLKFLEMAKKWKQNQQQQPTTSSESS
ncbi:Crooked neck-like protein 1 [Dermatophagoides pteronyssinus]|uniref:Crooked neck-like protein 1 n=1 Tax=Dermatophagoides pteronyssinus TaxID=6956 RepID=A0ABQ8JI98_DERPT|nr:Crooked neck-like protein 1 [Dermatophagoides pteronyssinus]